ncbi:hypothetical protein F4802DRAFT_619256 [Xylaria palmicola]|nr:hypothetical protein F4802DRAFT_619256 [Xylaria palmicola]
MPPNGHAANHDGALDVSDGSYLDYKNVCESGARYVRIYWHDYTSSAKCRVIPIDRVRAAFKRGEQFTITITKASLGILPTDVLVPGVTGTGVYVLQPDWSSARKGPADGHVSCQAFFREEDGAEARLCPRGILERAVRRGAAAGLRFLVGFEVEFTALRRDRGRPEGHQFAAIPHDGHAWSMARALAGWGAEDSFATVADEALEALRDAGVGAEQFHAEGAPGQYEIVLPPAAPLAACDALLHARQIVESAAARRGFRVTLHPRPFPSHIGNGSHAHLSIHACSRGGDGDGDVDGDVDRHVYERFYGGVLAHFPALLAFTSPHEASYQRLVDGLWAGGRWVAWGTQNKETPLRKCAGSHWELKVMDGLANPYLAVAALLHAGTAGAEAFTWGDCAVDPATLDDGQRQALGIVQRFPANLGEALEALERDDVMVGLVGQDVVARYVAVKQAEMDMLAGIPQEQRRQWIMERY